MNITMNKYEYEAMMVDSFERDKLLDLITQSIKTESYIDPQPIFHYMKTYYPNRLKRRMEALYEAQDDSCDSDPERCQR